MPAGYSSTALIRTRTSSATTLPLTGSAANISRLPRLPRTFTKVQRARPVHRGKPLSTNRHRPRPRRACPANTRLHRIAFPNPEGAAGGRRTSIGCLRGPFTTGVMADGKDTGDGFHVSQIEQNPSMFFTDVHSSLAVPGAVRGQLSGRSPC